MTTKPKSPFAALEALRGSLPEGPAPQAATAPEPAPVAAAGEKVVVARSKKGRGGKTVTTVVGIRPDAREALAHDLRKALGCGASVDEDAIIVQGDQVPRVVAFLEARGVRKVVVGS